VFFKSGQVGHGHNRGEWDLIKLAERCFEYKAPNMKELRTSLDNFGAHISRAKVVLGNVNVIDGVTQSRLFSPNFKNESFLLALELLHGLMMMGLEEYEIHQQRFSGSYPSVSEEIKRINLSFANDIQPRLRDMAI
ncbi:MAG: hypothetical protein ABIA59_08035, partial [Candidatus Latescibacterota bacterium]